MSDSHQRTLRTILTGTSGWLVLKNSQLAYEVVNPLFCQFLGKSPEEIVGKTDKDLFGAEEATAAFAEDKSVLKSGIPRASEQCFTGKDGLAWFSVYRAPIMDDNGDPAGIILTAHDISSFRQREQQVSKAEAEIKAARGSVKALEEQCGQLQQQLQAAAQAQSESAGRAQTLESQLDAHSSALAEAQEKVATWSARVTELETQLAGASQLEARLAEAQRLSAELAKVLNA